MLPQIRQLIIDAGVPYPVKINRMPDTRDGVGAVMVRDTGGVEADPNFTAYGTVDRTFQVIVRHDTYTEAENMVRIIRGALHGHRDGATTNMGVIRIFSEFQPITNEQGIYEFSANFRCKQYGD